MYRNGQENDVWQTLPARLAGRAGKRLEAHDCTQLFGGVPLTPLASGSRRSPWLTQDESFGKRDG